MKLLLIFLIPIIMLAHGNEKHEEKKQNPQKEILKEKKADIYESINKNYIQNIKPIFEVKCFDCHSNKTKYPWYYKIPIISSLIEKDIKEAKKHLDFSNDFPFISHETPKKDLISILEVFEKGTMPPLRYTLLHSNSKVTEADIEKVKHWVENSLKEIEKE